MSVFSKMSEGVGLSPKRRAAAWVLAVLTVAVLLFIWSNSLESREDSARKSALFVELVRPLVLALPVPQWHHEDTIHLITRKLAHFAQFFALGGLSSGFALAVRPARLIGIGWLALFCLAAATVDELLQFFSARVPAWQDVALDMAGALAGIFLVMLSHGWRMKRKEEGHA